MLLPAAHSLEAHGRGAPLLGAVQRCPGVGPLVVHQLANNPNTSQKDDHHYCVELAVQRETVRWGWGEADQHNIFHQDQEEEEGVGDQGEVRLPAALHVLLQGYGYNQGRHTAYQEWKNSAPHKCPQGSPRWAAFLLAGFYSANIEFSLKQNLDQEHQDDMDSKKDENLAVTHQWGVYNESPDGIDPGCDLGQHAHQDGQEFVGLISETQTGLVAMHPGHAKAQQDRGEQDLAERLLYVAGRVNTECNVIQEAWGTPSDQLCAVPQDDGRQERS